MSFIANRKTSICECEAIQQVKSGCTSADTFPLQTIIKFRYPAWWLSQLQSKIPIADKWEFKTRAALT
jgi:hypothetical protein